MKSGLVMEGGAMRGMFTAGVIDVLMENGIFTNGAIGTSAGAVFGCNYKSGQIGRVIRYNTEYCTDPRYVSFKSLVTTGDLYGEKFCYHDLPDTLDPFDAKAFSASKMEFYAVCTDVLTGKAVYHKCTDGGARDLQYLRASASMPIVSRVVEIENRKLLDGGIADSVPVKFFETLGYDRNIIVLTRPLDYIKTKNKFLPLLRAALRKYPAVVRAVEQRHVAYNATIEYIREKEMRGEVLVIRPKTPITVGTVERDAEKLKKIYNCGRDAVQEKLPEIKMFLQL